MAEPLRLSPRPGESRCPLCRESVARGDVVTCAGCGTSVHAACAAELGGCATLGCVEAGRRAPRATEPQPQRAEVPPGALSTPDAILAMGRVFSTAEGVAGERPSADEVLEAFRTRAAEIDHPGLEAGASPESPFRETDRPAAEAAEAARSASEALRALTERLDARDAALAAPPREPPAAPTGERPPMAPAEESLLEYLRRANAPDEVVRFVAPITFFSALLLTVSGTVLGARAVVAGVLLLVGTVAGVLVWRARGGQW